MKLPISKKELDELTLCDKVGAIPENDEWWDRSSEETFQKVAKQLTEKGFTGDEALSILEDCYSTVSSEFGN